MYRILFFFLMLSVCCSCQDAVQDQTDPQLEEAKNQISNLLEENRQLSDQLDQLYKDYNQLKLEHEMISYKREELVRWTNKLKDGYGTGLWQADELTYPIFKRPLESASVTEIIEELNKIYLANELPKVILKKIDGTKVYLTVDDSEKLTQRMGTSGASSYLQEIFFSVSSVKGIECVDLDFEAGDHAAPVEYCK